MAKANPVRHSGRGETLGRDVDALHRQINTLGLRLAKAQQRLQELEAENELLREAHQEIVDAVKAEQQEADPEYPAAAGYAKGTARRALNGDPPAALDGGGGQDE